MGQALPDMALMGSCILILLACTIKGVFGDEVKSVNDGDPVTLISGVTKHQHDRMQWYFNDTLIALINGDPSTSCLYDGVGGMFRDRLKVDYQTGSLNITNTRTEHTGRYEAEIIRSDSSGTSESLNRPSKCDSTRITKKTSILGDIIQSINLTVSGSALSPTVPDPGLSPGVVAGICVAAVVLLLAVVVVGLMIRHYRRSRNGQYQLQILHLVIRYASFCHSRGEETMAEGQVQTENRPSTEDRPCLPKILLTHTKKNLHMA